MVGRSCDLRQGARLEPGVGAGRGLPDRRRRRDPGRGEGLPVQDGGDRGHRQLVHRLGVHGARGSSSGATASGASPTSTSAPSWRSACPWPGPPPSDKGATITASRDTSRAARVLKRAIMVGCNAAGVNVDDLEVATVPVTRHQIRTSASQGGVTVRLAPDDPQSVVIRFFDARGARPDRDGPAQDRAALPPRGVPPGAGRRDRRHRLPAAGRRAATPPIWWGRSTCPAPGTAGFKMVLDLSYGSASFVHAQPAVQARRRRAGGQPLRPHPGHDVGGPCRPAPPGWPTWSGPRGPTWGRSSTPTAST